MKLSFRRLFTVEVTHAYYRQRCRDLEFTVPHSTAKLMRGHKLVAHLQDGWLDVLFEADPDGRPISALPALPLRFGLAVTNANIVNITDPADLPPGTINSYRNSTVRTRLDPPVRITPQALTTLDPAFTQRRTLGIVEITSQETFWAAAPVFTVRFAARAETLKYYVVVRDYPPSEVQDLAVTDAGFTDDARPEIHFRRVESSAFTGTELALETLAVNGAAVVGFFSTSPVARDERGLRRIELKNDRDTLVANLPQPGPARATADMIVHLSKRS